MTDAATPTESPTSTGNASTNTLSDLKGYANPLVTAFAFLVAVALVVGRFFVSTPMWLDEALSVNIASLPIGDIGEALKHDGHPPLYYVMLHGWMELFGDSTAAIRSLSAIISVVTLWFVYLAGKRLGGQRLAITAVLVMALSPYAFRYGSETRMYSLMMLVVLGGYLATTSAVQRATPLRLAGVAIAVAAGLWTQYWALWLVATGGLCVLYAAWNARRASRPEGVRSALLTAAAMILGGALFVPWLPTMLYQNEHTGTPWSEGFRPAGLIITSLASFTGGPYSEAQVGGLFIVVVVVIALFGTSAGRSAVRLSFDRLQRDTVLLAILVLGTIAIASAVAFVNGMAFAPRYAAVFYPFFALLIAIGIERFERGAVRNVILVAVTLFSAVGVYFVLNQDRSQVGDVAATIEERSDTALVLACPDQLGPSLGRALDTKRFELLAYPILDQPKLVDWVDYAKRNEALDPAALAAEVLERAGDRTIYVAYGDAFLTYEGQCEALIATIAAQRPQENLIEADPPAFYEPLHLLEFRPNAG